MKKYVQLFLSLVLGIGIGLLICILYYRINIWKPEPEAKRLKGYKYISPLLDYETVAELKNREIFILENKIERFINEKVKENEAIYISVYFRDLLNGPWFVINEKENFAPASLLKVPLMIAYLKQAEQNPELLKYELMYEKKINDNVRQNILPDREMETGKSYSIEELIYRMIVYSDNNAKNLLLIHINEDILNKGYSDIGIIVPDIREKSDFMTVKEYASFFRVLFNASYLNKEMSEKALEILTSSTFEIGIKSGVPSDIEVAHKFAERGDKTNNTLQLHDCGIVYHKERPYILSVMTYGRDFYILVDIIKSISTMVYTEVDTYYKNKR